VGNDRKEEEEGVKGVGMTVTVEGKTSQRRLIEYLLSPLMQYVDESVRER